MDQQLKARLIGAAILVAIAVIVIPELLSGRKAVEPSAMEPAVRGKRTYTIDLGGGTSQPSQLPVAETASAVVQPEAAQPVETPPVAAPSDETVADVESPAVESPVVDSPAVEAPPPQQEVAPPAQPAPSVPPPQQATRPATGGWAVQVGAFGNAGAAQKLVSELSGQGYTAFVSPVARNGKTLHRVRVGPETERAAVDRMAQQLKARGLPATVVAND